MVRIELKEDGGAYELTAKGHADYAPSGNDIVCASVSILIFTLIETIDEADLLEPSVVAVKKGDTLVRVRPNSAAKGKIHAVFKVISTGFEILQKNFEKNIKFSGGVG